MAAYHIRIVGGFVIWIFKGFKVPLKDCIKNYFYSFIIGFITILVVAYLCLFIYSRF
jgi:hypothetical protein